MATFTEDEKSMLTDEVFSHFERHYLDVRVAPLMASDEILAKKPRTHILVCEYDTLRDDGYGKSGEDSGNTDMVESI
ncbi:unnamed protein product [Clavelina lepadiformis]|uniref:Uncharacterized protein n=1 Tax=Clavelina lepadiformis TaxID=159417 RepID=A0ABP0GIG7_CLALP